MRAFALRRAVHGWRYATARRQALNVADPLHRALALGRVGLDQLIRDIAFGRRGYCKLGAGHFRTVLGLPGGRRTKIVTYRFAAAVVEHRLGADEKPLRLAWRIGLVAAFVGDLTDTDGFQHDGVAIGNLDRLRDARLGMGGCRCQYKAGGEQGESGLDDHGANSVGVMGQAITDCLIRTTHRVPFWMHRLNNNFACSLSIPC
ncbi:hypothetical protein D3C79_836570 [compost metagenome]